MLNLPFKKKMFLKRSMNIYKVQLFQLSPRGLEMIISMDKVMADASMYPASRIVIKPISINIPLF